MARLTLRGVTKRFQSRDSEVLALDRVDLDVADGEFVVLLGPSGCGKSTLLNLIAGLDQPDAGTLLEDDRPIRGPGRDRGVVFQDGALFPWLTAQANVEFGLKQLGAARRERAERARHWLEMVRLGPFASRWPHELSGGMRQRVAIARALATDPDVLLMDEPFSALDAQTREDLYLQLVELWEKTRKTIVFVTHNVREAVCLANRVVVLGAHPGRIRAQFAVQMGRPRFPDDVDVARLASQIAAAMKEDRRRVRQLEYDSDWDPAEDSVLRAADHLLGDSI